MEHSQTFSLTQLAELTGKGKTGLRMMIETGQLVATREDSGRMRWIVQRDDALAANLPLPPADECGARRLASASGMGSHGDPGLDSAMRRLLAEHLRPMEMQLERIESQISQSGAVPDIRGRPLSAEFGRIWTVVRDLATRLLRAARRHVS
jgi:hypothetical protein